MYPCWVWSLLCTSCVGFSRFPAAVASRPGAAAGELVAGGADDRAHLEIPALPRQAHLRTGPHTGQVAGRTYCPLLLWARCFSFLFCTDLKTHQHCRFFISHLVSHCAIPTHSSYSERLITCIPRRGEQPLSNLKYPLDHDSAELETRAEI